MNATRFAPVAGPQPVQWLTAKEVAKLLSVSVRFVQDLAADGTLPAARLSTAGVGGRGMLRFSASDVAAYQRRCMDAGRA